MSVNSIIGGNTDREFEARYTSSHVAVKLVKDILIDRGIDARMERPRLRPTGSDYETRRQYRDRGDILVRGGMVEAKWFRSCTWTGEDDYPYPEVLVDNADLFDAKVPTPLVYYAVSGDFLRYIMVHVSNTRAHWRRSGDVIVKADGVTRALYFCPKRLAVFRDVPRGIIDRYKLSVREMKK